MAHTGVFLHEVRARKFIVAIDCSHIGTIRDLISTDGEVHVRHSWGRSIEDELYFRLNLRNFLLLQTSQLPGMAISWLQMMEVAWNIQPECMHPLGYDSASIPFCQDLRNHGFGIL
jgi:hypothetical protein